MRHRIALAVATAAATLSLGAAAAGPATAAPQHPRAQTTGFTFCWHGPSLGSISIGWCF